MAGVVAYGSYLPVGRLERSAVAAALGTTPGRGTRTVASYDEDTTSLGVEAARRALAGTELVPDVVLLATAGPAYADKTNAATVAAALDLPEHVAAYDVAGAARSASGALRLALSSSLTTLVVLSDVRTGRPGSHDETAGGDGAVALLVSPHGAPLVELEGVGSTSADLLDRWRAPGSTSASLWEERFGEQAYRPLAQSAVEAAAKHAGLALDEVDHLAVTGLHARAVRSTVAWAGVGTERVVDDLAATVGNTGCAHPGLLLADVLDRAGPDEALLLVHLADGADAFVLRTTEAVAAGRQAVPVTQQAAAGRPVPYERFLGWRGQLDREPPRRPPLDSPAAPVAFRRSEWKLAFTASTCDACGARHLPPARVCFRCRAVDRMRPERVADARGTVATTTVDHLAPSPSPPVVTAVVDLDGGGRLLCELTDLDDEPVAVGSRVALTFRRLFTAPNGVHNYFWKAHVVHEEAA